MTSYKVKRNKDGSIKGFEKESNRRDFLKKVFGFTAACIVPTVQPFKNTIVEFFGEALEKTVEYEEGKPKDYIDLLDKLDDDNRLHELPEKIRDRLKGDTKENIDNKFEKKENVDIRDYMDYPKENKVNKIEDNLLEKDVERNYQALRNNKKYTIPLSNAFSELSQYQEYIQKGMEKTKFNISYMNLMYAMFVAESNGDRTAESKANAKGPAQFTKPTAIEMGLRVDDIIDERSSPKSLTKGVEYLDKINIYNDEKLMLIAYNYGPPKTIKIVNKYGKKWKDIKHKIPKETRNYVIKVLSRKRLLDNGDVEFDKKQLFSERFGEYVFQDGDYMYKVARNFGINPELLVQCNPEVINHYKLKKGDVIFIPKNLK